MNDSKSNADPEFSAIQTIYSTLKPLNDDARMRVVNYVVARLSIVLESISTSSEDGKLINSNRENEIKIEDENDQNFDSFAELYDATQPKTHVLKALVAGYWFQVCQNAATFDSHSVNKELKNLGEGLSNVTNSIDRLKNQKPSLVLQIKKSGKSKQARKTYKVTTAGIKVVKDMVDTV